MNSDNSVTIFGLGYIGLPTAALIASRKIRVHGVDTQGKVVDIINRGEVHIIEPDLEGLVRSVVDRKYLTAHTEPVKSQVYIVAVPTPVSEGHQPDMRYVEAVIDAMTPLLEPGNLVIIESTSPVGTTASMHERIIAQRPELRKEILMAYCPERVLPGNVLHELEYNDRVVGGINDISSEAARKVYAQFVKGKIHLTSAPIAEMCKLTENAYRDVNIAFANELSVICHDAGIDVNELIKLANFHPRVNILTPGVGVGGHCIAVDPWFIISAYPGKSDIMRTARETNDAKRDWVIAQIIQAAGDFEEKQGRKPVIACMGLSYKPDIDDLRESPALYITHKLVGDSGYEILPCEPHVREITGMHLISADEAIKRADIIVFLVKHLVFRALKPGPDKVVLDFCGIGPG